MDRNKIIGPGLLLGIGLGGFVDGILIHQILGWHHMVSSRTSDLRLNTIADGLFHAGTWVAVLAGVVWLWRSLTTAPDRGLPVRALAGLLLAGWGLFNLVEGLIDHHLLGVHHVRHGPDQLAYDLGFLAISAVILAAGWLLFRTSASRPARPQ
jgi:uncharacterized membrane protein